MPTVNSIRWKTYTQNKHPVWNRWRKMIHRCHGRKADPEYLNRGIEVCKRWRDSFEAFISDIGEPPTLEHTIERINNNGWYEPGNCRWATMKEQARNRRNTMKYSLGEVCLTVEEWASRLGISEVNLRSRIRKGWPIEKALTTLSRQKRNAPKQATGLLAWAIY